MAKIKLDNNLPDGFVLDSKGAEGSTSGKLPSGFLLDQNIDQNVSNNSNSEKGFFSRVGEDLSKRKQNIGNIFNENQTFPEDILQTSGQLAGGALDVGGEVFNSALKGVSALTPDFIEQPIKDVASDIGEAIISSRVGKLGLKSIKNGIESYMDFKGKYPRAARNLEATFNLGLIFSPVKKKPMISSTNLKKISNKSIELANKITPKKSISLTSEDIANIASKKYMKAEMLGGNINPDTVASILDDLKKFQPQTELGKIVIGRNVVTRLLGRLEKGRRLPKVKRSKILDANGKPLITDIASNQINAKPKPITLKELQEVDEHLTALIDENSINGRITKNGLKIKQIQEKLRNTVDNLDKNDLVNSNGFEALKEARQLWSRSARLRDIENIISRAELMDQPAAAIKNGFRSLLTRKSGLRGYSKAEKDAIKKAATTGLIDEVLRIPGSRLTGIISGVTRGPGIGFAATAASNTARSTRETLAFKKAKKVYDLVLQGGQIKSNNALSKSVVKKVNSLGGATLKNFANAINYIDQAIVQETNKNIIRNLRLDRAAILEVIDNFKEDN